MSCKKRTLQLYEYFNTQLSDVVILQCFRLCEKSCASIYLWCGMNMSFLIPGKSISSQIQAYHLQNNEAEFGNSVILFWAQNTVHIKLYVQHSAYFYKKLEGIISFDGPLTPLFWTSGYVCLKFQIQDGSLTCMCFDLCVRDTYMYDSPLSTTSADLLASKPFTHMLFQAVVGVHA